MSTIQGKKISPKKTEELEQSVINYRGAIKQAEEFLTLQDHPGWKNFMADVDNQIARVEIVLHNFDKLDHDKRTIELQKMRDLKWLKGVIGRAEENLPKLVEALTQCESELVARKRGTSVPA